MEDAHRIVLQGLEQAGVDLPPGADSVQDLSSSALVSISSKALALIRGAGAAPPFPSSLPQSMSERFRICNDLAAAVKELGYRGDLSFPQFLYPSEEETHKLLRFFLDKLSTSSSSIRVRGGKKSRGSKFAREGIIVSKTLTTVRQALSLLLDEANQNIAVVQQATDDALAENNQAYFENVTARVPFRTSPLRLASSSATPGRKTPALITLQAKPKARLIPSVLELNEKNALRAATILDDRLAHLAQRADDYTADGIQDVKFVTKGSLHEASDGDAAAHATSRNSSLLRAAMFSKERDIMLLQEHIMRRDAESNKAQVSEQESTFDSSDEQIDPQERELSRLQEKLSSITIENTKLAEEAAKQDQGVKDLELEFEASSEQSVSLSRKYSTLKVALDMALDAAVPEDSKIQKLKLSIETSQQQLAALHTEWESWNKQLEQKKFDLESSAQSGREELQTKVKQVKETRQQIKDIASKVKHREEQLAAFVAELENVAKGPSRNIYVRRITELIKNSKKQDDDISRIIAEMRNLQRESNANQGRLRRTHALVDELIFRDAKKDPACRHAYRLLSSIHENFADCYEKIFSIDKVRRDITELQATMEILDRWPVDLKKVQADFDAIVAENQSLEKNLQVMKNHR